MNSIIRSLFRPLVHPSGYSTNMQRVINSQVVNSGARSPRHSQIIILSQTALLHTSGVTKQDLTHPLPSGDKVNIADSSGYKDFSSPSPYKTKNKPFRYGYRQKFFDAGRLMI